MTNKSHNPHENSADPVLLPPWMRLTALLSVVLVFGILVISLANGADRTPAEQSPYRSVPEEVLSPNG